MNIIFFGACSGENNADYLCRYDRGMPQIAAHKVCWLFIRGLDSILNRPCDVLCSVAVSRFPVFQKLLPFLLPDWDRGGGAKGRYLAYVNLPGLRYLTTASVGFVRLLVWNIRKTPKRQAGPCIIVAYAMYLPHMLATVAVAKIIGLKTVLIVPDLPEYMDVSSRQFVLLRWVRSIYARIGHMLARQYDGYVLFSSGMAERLRVGSKPWALVEGCVDDGSEIETGPTDFRLTSVKRRTIFYAGSLSPLYGIRTLLDAFGLLPQLDCELHICGHGGISEEIRKRSERDPRIRFHGVVPNERVLQMEHAATVLINPRSGTHLFTRYSFPSKNLEYLRSGRPAIFYSLPDMPKEYAEYAYIVEGEGAEALAETVQRVLLKTDEELAEKGARAKEFVLSEKNPAKQASRILEVVNKVILM